MWEQFRTDLLCSEPYTNPLRLEKYGYKVFSQNDEDGIINEIFKRIGTTNKVFVEFGVENGLECNSYYLLMNDWHGLWIEGSKDCCNQIKNNFTVVLDGAKPSLTLINKYITCENINELIESSGITREIDLLSIDIDGNDYHVFKEIDVISPRVVIVEYNAKFPSNFSWIMEYNPTHIWDASDKQGASLKALELLAREKGYRLIGTNLSGVNAFFVREDLAGNLFAEPATAENLYNPGRFAMGMTYISGHPSKHCLMSEK